MSHYPIRFEHFLIFVTSTALLLSLWQIYKPKIKKIGQRLKLYFLRNWKPKSPKDCPGCQSGIELAILKPNQDVIPFSHRKSTRGRSKRITTTGHACPNPDCGNRCNGKSRGSQKQAKIDIRAKMDGSKPNNHKIEGDGLVEYPTRKNKLKAERLISRATSGGGARGV